MEQQIIMQLKLIKQNKSFDILVPAELTANELIVGLNQAFSLGVDCSDLSQCYLQTENPIALLKGNRCIREYGLHHGSIIHFTR
ncbi:EsaB/YukD family protein [Anaerosporobacter faecicola]|uniref:EsaB/YukD family protein n=1 Tax=Anaerosporobacter faecicola TaxID=2718714 RepID=UPI00143A6821|nr:EsaB/YukD family protein [Anaerosporobacter faecicola]